MNIRNTFKKKERLRSKKWIQHAFAKGTRFTRFPIQVIFVNHPDPEAQVDQVLISVSKRNISRAVDRNKIKRRMREGYRLCKQQLDPSSKKHVIVYLYISKQIVPFKIIQESIKQSLKRLNKIE